MKKHDIEEVVSVDERIGGCLLDNGTHFLIGEINDDTVGNAIKWIVYENMIKKHRTLNLFINSSGGDLYQAFALIDIMNQSSIPIRAIGIGQIMSAAFLIFVAASERQVAKNTGIMCHQYSDSPVGKHHDLKEQMLEGERCHHRMLDIIKNATGLTPAKIKSRLLCASDVYLSAEEAVELGIAHSIL